MLSYEEFQRLSDVEDAMWLQSAQEGAAEGYLSAAETDDFFKKRLLPAQEVSTSR